MITETQLKRFPPLFQEIIDVQRKLDLILSAPVIPLTQAGMVKELGDRVRELSTYADRIYGKVANDGGKATA